MADRRVQFTLGVNVDSAKAKAQLSDLQRTLDKLTSTQKGGGLEHLPITKSIFDATASAKELQQYLREATNVKTGSLDLSILSKSLKDSGKTLKDYRLAFEELGPSGEAAFRKIASSIAQAEAPMKRTNKLIEDMKTSLSNTIKWQISSSAIHAFMGAIQGAYGYAKDLNQSLNNIRIVTGQSTEQMAKFAVEANKSAKALSTTTTEYTDAALIYYQQGLSDEQVKQRTDITIKMANVARESAVTVSDQMTAVWNNFYDGSKSLEYYSDVMTALGAATASSTSEISAGLEKFAAVADTVGLSYEYATAALATVTSETRQSADVVGTAFRTLFTRIQGLQQGETADDGVNLNKYSQALANVGIQILDTNDQIKSMDTILNELGERWKTLGNEQKIALAQTVGGARQYTTLIALMDNWTSFQDNLTTAYGATGALQEQAEIYAESWEAAQEKVTAALEKIYSQLLNDKFFIGFSNALADGIDLISKLIDTLGGLPGVLGITGLAFTTLFKDSLPEFINNSVRKLQDFTGVTLKNADLVRQDALKQNAFLTQNDITDKGLAEQARDSHYVERINQLKKTSLDLDEAQIKKLRIKIELEKELASTVIEDAEKVDEAGEAYRNAKANANKVRKKVLGKDENDERYKKLKSTKFYKDDGSFNEKFKFTKTFAKKNGYSEDEIKELKKLAAAEFEVIKKLKEKKEAEHQLNEDNKKFSEIRKKELSDLLDLQDKGLDQTKYYTSVMEEGFIAAGEAIGTAATAFASISSIVKTAGDDSLSSFEKIERIFPSLLVAIPSLATAIKQGWLAAKLLNTEGLKGIQIKVAESILDAETVEKIKERISWTAIYEELIKKETTTKSANIVVTKALEWANGSLLKTTVLLAGAFAAVVAAGWILIKLWESMKNNSPEGQLKKANEELERAKKEAAEASNAYNNLKSSIDSLKSAQNTLAGLTKGTREWKEAVLAVNQQVIDLIDKYPELAPFLRSDGEILRIDEEGYDIVLDNMMKRAEATSLAVLQGEKEVAQLREQQSKTDEKRIGAVTKVGYKTGGSNEFIYNVNDEQSEEYEKYYSDIGATRTEYKSEMSIGEATDLYERIKKAGAFNEDGTISLEKAKAAEIDITEQQVKVIEKNMGAIIQHSAELEASTKQIKTYNKAIGDQWVKNNKKVPDYLKDAYGLGVGMLADSYMDTARENVGDLSGQELYNRYSLYSGMSVDEIKKKVAEDDSFTQTMLDAIINNEALSLASNEVDTRLKTIQEDENGVYQTRPLEGQKIIDQWIASGGDMSFIDALTDQELELIKPFFENLPSQIAEWFKEGATEAQNLIKDPNYSIQAEEKRKERYDEKERVLASRYGMDKAGLDAYQEDLEDKIPTLEEYVDEMGEYDELVLEITEDSLKWSKAGKKLGKTLEDLADDLNSNDIETYQAALKTLSDEITAWTGIEIDSSVAEQLWNSGVLEKAIAGNQDAIETVYKKSIEYQASTWDLAEGGAAQVVDFVNKTYDYIANKNIKIGAIDDSLFADGLNQMIMNSGLTAAQIENILSSTNMDATVTQIHIKDIVGNKTEGYKWTNPVTGETIDIPEQTYNIMQEGNLTLPFVSNVKFKGVKSEFNFTPVNKSSGGGSSKKDKKSSSKEIERYHVISNEMEEVQNELDKISTATERAFGADKLALIDDEIQKMKELKDAQDEYVRQIEENFEKDKQAIAAYGAVFDEDGTILNYEEIMQRQIDKFNASRTDAAEEEYQKFLDLLKQYEETNDLLDKERNESIKQAGELLDKKLEDVEHRVNLQVEFNDDTIEYLEFLLEQLEDQAFSAAQSIDLLGRQVQENFDNIKSNSSGLAETLALAGFDSETIDGVLTGDQAAINKMMSQKGIDNNIIESVKEYRDALMGSMSNVRDLQKAIDEELINSLDEASEKFGELHDELNHNADILSSLQNIMDLTGESILGFTDDAKKALEDAQLDTAISQVATSYDELTMAQEEYKKAVESDQSEEVIKAAAEKVREAEEQLLSDWEAALEQATTNFEASIERSVAAFSNAVAGAYGGLDELQDAFDKQEELDDIYIEDYKKIYELTKLSRDISRSIDDSDNIKAKQALRDLQGEINELQKEGVELSEYDIEYLQKKYELRLAEIALEEAQNAKSTVRMTRDSEGNWSYTYTADQDDINEAQQNYEDKLYAIQELSDNYIKDMQSQVLDLLSAYEDEMAKINFSEEGWEQKAKEIEAFYQAKFNLLAQQFEGALGNQSDIYGEWEDYSALTGYGISANQDFIDSFDETTLSQLTGFQTMGEYQQVFTTNSQKLLTDLSGSFMDWRDHVQRIYEQAGKSTEDFAEKVGDMAEGVKEDNQSVADSSELLKNEVIDNFEEAANGASAFADTWNEKIKTMTDSNNDLVESINDIIEAWARLNNAEEEKNRKQEQNEQEEKNDSSNNNNNNNNNNKTLSENDSVSVKTSATHFATGQQMAGFVPGGSYSVMQVSGDRVLIGRNGVATGWVKKTDLVGFHSGGYTGEWGSSGKLAMLHEKELVLNANDTKNILTSVELMREISQAIDLNASMSAYSNAISAAMPNTGVITNQNIVINAEFPDATDRLEIQAAFDNLLNRASQYANRK